MQRAAAIKQLSKILGKSLGYRVDPKAPLEEERVCLKIALKAATEKANELLKQKELRIKTLLDNDVEFQEIKTAYEAAKKDKNSLASRCYQYKFTVGTSDGMFFHVKAQGDSWEEIFAKLDSSQTTR
jgi:hypothetical protein